MTLSRNKRFAACLEKNCHDKSCIKWLYSFQSRNIITNDKLLNAILSRIVQLEWKNTDYEVIPLAYVYLNFDKFTKTWSSL